MVIPILIFLIAVGTWVFWQFLKNIYKSSNKEDETPNELDNEDLTLISKARELELQQQQSAKQIEDLDYRNTLFKKSYAKTFPNRVQETIQEEQKNQEEQSQIKEAQQKAQSPHLIQAPLPPQEQNQQFPLQKERLKEESEEEIRKKLKSSLSYNRTQRQVRNSTIK